MDGEWTAAKTRDNGCSISYSVIERLSNKDQREEVKPMDPDDAVQDSRKSIWIAVYAGIETLDLRGITDAAGTTYSKA